jgi:hypothetical protein
MNSKNVLVGLLVLFVRINPRKQSPIFYRAGFKFTHEWQEVAVDDATASCLYGEQALEVVDTLPIEPDELLGDGDESTVRGELIEPLTDATHPSTSSGRTGDDAVLGEPVDTVRGEPVEPPVDAVAVEQPVDPVLGEPVEPPVDAVDNGKKKGKS